MDPILDIELTNEDMMRGKYLTFIVGAGVYGVEISYVTEIIKIQDITAVPHTKKYVKGVINMRGAIIPIIDMRLRFSMEAIGYTDRTCIIVLSMDGVNIGLIVDEVQEVLDIKDGDMRPPPRTSAAGRNYFVKAIGLYGGAVKQLLDIGIIFEAEEEAAEAAG